MLPEYAFIAPVSFLPTLVYASFVEWTVHRYMHRPTVWFRHLFRSHVRVHHEQHHRKHYTNFNVLPPIADYVLRTRRPPAMEGKSSGQPLEVMAQVEMGSTG